jgi:UDP-N-acetylglucosamine acyltransferase
VARVHPLAVVHPGAKLADDVEVGPFAVIGPEVELAAGVEVRTHALVTGRTRVGERARIFPFAALGEEPQDKSFSGEVTRLEIGCDTVIREHAVIHVGTVKGGGCTRIGDDTMIMNGVHVGHDSQVGSHVIIASHAALGGHVLVEDYAVIGGLAGIHQFARIGESAMVGAISGVTLDAPPFSLVSGERARLRGLNVIGMRRRGFSAETRAHIKHAFHVLFQSKLRKEVALERLRAELPDGPEVQRLLRFVEASERGVSR